MIFRRYDYFFASIGLKADFPQLFNPVFLKYNYLLFVHGRDTIITHQVRSSWNR
jgi:hypothetical protein